MRRFQPSMHSYTEPYGGWLDDLATAGKAKIAAGQEALASGQRKITGLENQGKQAARTVSDAPQKLQDEATGLAYKVVGGIAVAGLIAWLALRGK